MKICIVGSHGVGKTTLAKALAKKLKWKFIPDVVRMPGGAFDKGFPIDEFTAPESQFWILSKQLEFERNTKEPWICDKSLYDNLVYGELTFKDKRILEILREIVLRNAKYDLIIYLAPAFPLGKSEKEILPSGEIRWKTRSPDVKFQKIVDEKYKSFLQENKNLFHFVQQNLVSRLARNKINYIEIKEADFKKRLKTAIKIIKKLLVHS